MIMSKEANDDVFVTTTYRSYCCFQDQAMKGLDHLREGNAAGKNPEKKYGWCGIHFKCLQIVNKPVVFLLFICFLVVSQGMIITGITSIIVTSIQTRYGFTSVQAGALSSSYDTAYGVSSILISFFGHKRKPLFLGIGSLILAVGCLIASIPHYLVGKYHAGVVRDIDWCHVNNTLTTDTEYCKGGAWYYLAVFCLAYITMGIGATPIYILGPSHLDESSKRGTSGLYIGIMYAFAALGPAVGYLMGRPILNTYVDITQPEGSNLSPNDSIWVGAWWIGYLVGCGMFLIVFIPMLGFPQEFKSTEKLREEKRDLEDTVPEEISTGTTPKHLWQAVRALLLNKCYIFISLAVTAEGLTTGGFSTFLPKFFESQFMITSSDASFYTGLVVVPGAAGGIFLGGYLMKRFDWNCKKTLKMSMVFSFLAFAATAAIMIGCKTKKIYGVNVAYHGENVANSIHSSCRTNCSCSHMYKPICIKETEVMYFSPCHAGCAREFTQDSKYFNCSCFPPNITVAEKGGCYSECNLMYAFMPAFLITMVFTFLNNVPLIEATFRVVPPSQSSFALGFQQVFVRFLGFIPGPILFGKMVDKACILWQVDGCGRGESKNCLEYNNSHFRYYFYAIGGAFKLLSFIFLYLAYRSYIPPCVKRKVVSSVSNSSQRDLVLSELPPSLDFPPGDLNQNSDVCV